MLGGVELVSEQFAKEGLHSSWVDDTDITQFLPRALRNRLILLWAESQYNKITLLHEILRHKEEISSVC